MKLKPIVKTHENKNNLASWIIEKFPEGYENMTYIEPFLGGGGVLLNKLRSKEEIANDSDIGIIRIWQAVRDEPKEFLSRIKRIKYKETTFRLHLGKSSSVEIDYMNSAISEFILRNMSKGALKKVFLDSEKSKKKEHCWQTIFERISEISERTQGVFLLNKNAMDILKPFSDANSLVYCDPPAIGDDGMDSNKHVELGEILKNFKGKVIISGQNSAIYKRLYTGWVRKGVPGRPKESIWMNF